VSRSLVRFKAHLERFLTQRWYAQSPGVLWLFWPLEWIYRAVIWTQLRHLPSKKSVPPCIVVGNITVGGTGKTPFVIALVLWLRSQGLQVGVVSRGYGRTLRTPVEVSQQTSAEEAGDEPLLIHQASGAIVVVDEDRARACSTLSGRVDVVVSDDGLQHHAMARSIEIVLVDAERRLGNGHCLPVGPLRQPAARLKSVDYEILRASQADSECAYLRPLGFTSIRDQQRRSISEMQAISPTINVVTAIAAPERLRSDLEDLGFKVHLRSFADHHQFSLADFQGLADNAIVITGKDSVKVPAELSNCWVYQVEMQIPEPVLQSLWTQLKELL
jgi:tetraacyldisaccharide 4'-kinase